MKNLINILSSFALFSSATTCIVACKSDKKDLKNLSESLAIDSTKTVNDFKVKLIAKIKAVSGFENLSDSEINITKKDGNDLKDSDITGTSIEVKN